MGEVQKKGGTYAIHHRARFAHALRNPRHGPRVLFISGTGGDLRRSPNAFDWPLTKHFEVLAYDQRGLGQTDRPDAPYTMADYAADADALLQAVGWDRCMVIGVSFGGMVAQEFAIRYQHRVEKLVLCCTSSGGAGGASYPLHEVKGLTLEEYARLVITLADNRRDAAWQAAHQQEFQTLLKDTLNGLKMGADEPGRAMAAVDSLKPVKITTRIAACQHCRCRSSFAVVAMTASPPSITRKQC